MNVRNLELSNLELSQPISSWAKQTPDAVAISTNDVDLTYAELEDHVMRCFLGR